MTINGAFETPSPEERIFDGIGRSGRS